MIVDAASHHSNARDKHLSDIAGSSGLSDNLLLDGLRRGDQQAFDGLFLRHYEPVFRILLRLTRSKEQAEDLVQEVFVKLVTHPPTGGAKLSIGAWLYRVAVNAAYNALRSQQRQTLRDERAAAMDQRDAGSDPAAAAIIAEQRDAVRRSLAQLPANYQAALALRYEGCSYSEIATVIGVKPNAVGTILVRAEQQFRAHYSSQTND